ncbi:DUF3820 family protein [Amphritea atlantica]|uniref:DUF3820 family protein n=1 Tax=Amphritea atlantica TaxID=355243 RepID=UPI003F52961A
MSDKPIPYEARMEITPERLQKLANMPMPFGKYKGRLLLELPEPYLVWFAGKGFPEGEIGILLQILYEVKLNGLEDVLRPLTKRY